MLVFELVGSTKIVTADVSGLFHVVDVPLVRGENRLEFRSSDVAGNTSNGSLVIMMEDRDGPTIKVNLSEDTVHLHLIL